LLYFGKVNTKDEISTIMKAANPYEYTAEQEEYSKLPECVSCGYQTFCGT
jgi:hypothetical protein